MTLRTLFVTSALALTTLLTACGPGRPASEARTVGVDTPLGQTLTKTQWCTPATTDSAERPTFSTLEIRQNGKYIKSAYTLAPDRSLKLQAKEQGRWSLIFDQLYTKPSLPNAVEAQSTVATTDAAAAIGSASSKATSSKTATGEACITLTMTAHPVDTFCACDFVKN